MVGIDEPRTGVAGGVGPVDLHRPVGFTLIAVVEDEPSVRTLVDLIGGGSFELIAEPCSAPDLLDRIAAILGASGDGRA